MIEKTEPPGTHEAMNMSDDELLQGPIEMLRNGDLDGAIADLDAKMGQHKENAQLSAL